MNTHIRTKNVPSSKPYLVCGILWAILAFVFPMYKLSSYVVIAGIVILAYVGMRKGKVFKDTMEGFVKDVRRDIKKTFNNDDFEKEKQLIKQEFEAKRELLLEKLNKRTMVQGFQVKSTANGVYMMPVLDGRTLQEEEFEKLDEELKKENQNDNNITIFVSFFISVYLCSGKERFFILVNHYGGDTQCQVMQYLNRSSRS